VHNLVLRNLLSYSFIDSQSSSVDIGFYELNDHSRVAVPGQSHRIKLVDTAEASLCPPAVTAESPASSASVESLFNDRVDPSSSPLTHSANQYLDHANLDNSPATETSLASSQSDNMLTSDGQLCVTNSVRNKGYIARETAAIAGQSMNQEMCMPSGSLNLLAHHSETIFTAADFNTDCVVRDDTCVDDADTIEASQFEAGSEVSMQQIVNLLVFEALILLNFSSINCWQSDISKW
jgi:hypothetical protein